MNQTYRKQVGLLLSVLPEVAKETCFAMHGGTAINLFVRDMPRLSVDIDLTYVEISPREHALASINKALMRIKGRIERLLPRVRVHHSSDACKLQLDEGGMLIKIEVNMVGRGLLGAPEERPLCNAAQETFDAFCVMSLVPRPQLYGGKLCAALDRQHPRDLFDIKLLLENEGLNDEIRPGLVYGLVCSNRPTHEMLDPNLLDQRATFENQFEGMSALAFTYENYEQVRQGLIKRVREALGEKDRIFLSSFNRLEPEWSIYNFQDFPSVKWKLFNLERFKQTRPGAYAKQLRLLEKILDR
ncbi:MULTISPECIES: nucleotidyl transferase AbiEii/AbiGii toxin family protein [unclassified Marinimicrobium]|mgnify:CR=1 FL=1|jgi:predicted nucleotidyltransferase component of viral defense system|uniref:nucleotidyl transferase AbiEii/AbiGii toxin family protein n=1 Tax=unclassified Marinimicrobium TaxID=2632100 RepID=UPI000C4E2817|nr:MULTISPECIES: nucleotidyl transferase AbiEii/AbiGii toxin family protein [unclassified Marinimicrobium]MAN50953.1 nucleotidyltransferase [Marinimicrobium sp.]|tara:strand:- start:369 stop:1268 length:900 start_codon:yes stop_codon:yes gene_type:complete